MDQAPAAIRQRIADAIAHDYAVGTSYVLYGMAIALGICFFIALRHPGGQVTDSIAEAAADPQVDAAASGETASA